MDDHPQKQIRDDFEQNVRDMTIAELLAFASLLQSTAQSEALQIVIAQIATKRIARIKARFAA